MAAIKFLEELRTELRGPNLFVNTSSCWIRVTVAGVTKGLCLERDGASSLMIDLKSKVASSLIEQRFGIALSGTNKIVRVYPPAIHTAAGDDLIETEDDLRELFLQPPNVVVTLAVLTNAPAASLVTPKQSVEWKCKIGYHMHDFFVSYRVRCEADMAERFASALGVRSRHHAYLDHLCLVPGVEWDQGFINGLQSSTMILPLISDACISTMTTPHADNVLLEWELSLQRRDADPSCIIVPILVPSPTTGKPFSSFNTSIYPDILHDHPRSPRVRTVRDTITRMFTLQGLHVDPDAIEAVVPRLRQIRNVLLGAADTGVDLRDVALLTAEENDAIINWLRPVDVDRDRARLGREWHPGTRKWIVDEVIEWLTDPVARILLLIAPAGTGKSVMANLVANELQPRNELGGAFFCKFDDEQRSGAAALVRSIAHQLSRWWPAFGRVLLGVRDVDPGCVDADVTRLFQTVLVEPLSQVATSAPGTAVIIVDALDECGSRNAREDVLALFAKESRRLPTFVRLVITSRPDPDIMKAFEGSGLPIARLEPTPQRNVVDAIVVAKARLEEIGVDGDAEDFLLCMKILVTNCEGVFVWLALALKTLEDLGTPVTADIVESLPVGLSGLYDLTFGRIYGRRTEDFLSSVTKTLVIAREPLTVEELAKVMRLKLSEVEYCVGRLRPVLGASGKNKPVRMVHKTVTEYLLDCKGKAWYVDRAQADREMERYCFAILETQLRFNILDLDLTELKDLTAETRAKIDPALKYAATWWPTHLLGGGDASVAKLKTDAEALVKSRLLPWAEAMSIAQRLPAVLDSLRKLGDASVVAREYAGDAVRLLQAFAAPVGSNPLQLYRTALPFAPTGSVVRAENIARYKAMRVPAVLVGGEEGWSACLAVFGKVGEPWCVATSSTGKVAVGEKIIRVLDCVAGVEVISWDHSVEKEGIRALLFSRDGRTLFAMGADRVRVWDVFTGDEMKTLTHVGVNHVSLSPTLGLITASQDLIHLWDATLATSIAVTVPYLRIFSAPLGPLIVTHASESITISTLLPTVRALLTLPVPDADISAFLSEQDDPTLTLANFISVASHPSGALAVVLLTVFTIYSASGELILRDDTRVHANLYTTAANDALLAVTVREPDKVYGAPLDVIRLWDWREGRWVGGAPMRGHYDVVDGVVVTTGGLVVSCCYSDSTVRVWDPTVLSGDGDVSACLSDRVCGGRVVVRHGEDEALGVMDVSSGLIVALGGSAGVTAQTMGGGRVVASVKDGMRVWDATTGAEVARTEAGAGATVVAVGVAGDMVAWAVGKRVGMWSWQAGEEVREREFEPLTSVVTLRFRERGAQLDVAYWHEHMIWDLTTDTVSQAFLDRVNLESSQAPTVRDNRLSLRPGGPQLFWVPRELLQNGPNPPITFDDGRWSVALERQGKRSEHVIVSIDALVEEAGADVVGALMAYAAHSGDTDAADWCILRGFALDRTPKQGVLMMLAVRNGSVEVVKRLIGMGMGEENVPGEELVGGALHTAAFLGREGCVRSLLEGGWAIDAANANGETPVMLAFAGRHGGVIRVLLDAGANSEVLKSISGESIEEYLSRSST
ncbi:hypothetical protein HK101_007329 [Irineochytrium annulatum]|nr:hypothetical protein HK101_007329 [Irineochytrium annulatum]